VKQGTGSEEVNAGGKAMRRPPVEYKRLRAVALSLSLLLAGVLWAQKALWAQTAKGTNAAITDMKLVAPGSGWALATDRLFWTSDNGQNWDDITPANTQLGISKAFFLDAKTGWAILPRSDGASVMVASTRNGGKSWRNAEVALDAATQGRQLAGAASVYFTDAQHGWLIVTLASSSNFSIGAAFHTEDGGSTWTALPTPPAAGNISFTTAQNGWMVGGPAQDQIWFTHDGGATWQSATISVPEGCGGSQTVYNLPVFTGSNNGQLTASRVNSTSNCTIDYVTADGGQSWQTAQVSKNSTAQRVAAASTGTQTRHAYISNAKITVEQDGARHQGTIPAGLQPNGNITHAEFIDDSTGWLNYSSGECQASKANCSQQSELLATVDSGQTFTTITPHNAASQQTSASASLPLSRNSYASMLLGSSVRNAATAEAVPGSGTVVSTSAGLDMACAPETADMQTWWTHSPYQDFGVYLGGCDVYCVSPGGQDTCGADWHPGISKTVDTNLTPAWYTNVTKMGWGILPIWVGPQSPCIANASSYWTINNADNLSTGTYQADLAVAKANALGITSGIIYYDIEGYTPDGGTCSAAVETFLESWTSELHAQGFASGLYGGMSAFETDFIDLGTEEPDAAWFAMWDSNSTVFNLGTLSNSYWPTHQRIHQWNSESGGETWGGTTFDSIDQDTVDAPVVGDWLATSPSFALSNSAAITITTLGSTGTSTIFVTPSAGFTGVVNLSCSISPSTAIRPTCSVPSSVTITGTAASTATLTITTTAGTIAKNSSRKNFFLGSGGSVFLCLLLFGIPRRRLNWRAILGVCVLAVSIGTIAGCCSGSGTTSKGSSGTSSEGTTTGTYAVTVIGVDQASGVIKSNTTVDLTVN
jgi:hypothetical protein